MKVHYDDALSPAPCHVPHANILSLLLSKALYQVFSLTLFAALISLLDKLFVGLIEHLRSEFLLHVIDLDLVVIDGALQVLIVILVPLDDVEVALRKTPMSHGFPIHIVKVVKEHAGLEVLEL